MRRGAERRIPASSIRPGDYIAMSGGVGFEFRQVTAVMLDPNADLVHMNVRGTDLPVIVPFSKLALAEVAFSGSVKMEKTGELSWRLVK